MRTFGHEIQKNVIVTHLLPSKYISGNLSLLGLTSLRRPAVDLLHCSTFPLATQIAVNKGFFD